jgi:hypothetical protein
VGNCHDRAPTPGQRGVKLIATVDRHPLHELLTRQIAQEQKVHEHASVVLERATRDARHLGV